MASRFSSRIANRLLRATTNHHQHHHFTTLPKLHPGHHPFSPFRPPKPHQPVFLARFFSTARLRQPARPTKPDIGARARQLQTRRLWYYATAFSCIAGFIVIVLNQFQDQLVFYITPTDALSKYTSNPSKSKFRLGGLVLEGSVSQVPASPEIQFVITDLITDILVRYQGSLPDLFREGHSVVVEGFVKPVKEEDREREEKLGSERVREVSKKARELDCYFEATEVLAKHDEKYMPQEVAAAIEKNKKKLVEEEEERKKSGDGGATVTAVAS